MLSRAENEADSNLNKHHSSLFSNCFFTILNCLQILHKPFTNFQTFLNILNFFPLLFC